MRAIAYIRVSDVSQIDGHSLDAQERLFHQLCQTRGWTPEGVYREEGRSAHSDSLSKRPVFRKLLDDAASNEFDVVVVHTLDRWARNLKVLLETVAILDQHGVGLVSITENLDWSTPEGRLVARTVGSFSEFFSDMLGTHVKKGISERAIQGLHLGGIPFGYQPCWERIDGERRRTCNPEHPGGMHRLDPEAGAVLEMFHRYATGTTTLAGLATWLNDQGFRTRNNKKLPGPDGVLVAGPRLFTTAVGTILYKNDGGYDHLRLTKGEPRRSQRLLYTHPGLSGVLPLVGNTSKPVQLCSVKKPGIVPGFRFDELMELVGKAQSIVFITLPLCR